MAMSALVRRLTEDQADVTRRCNDIITARSYMDDRGLSKATLRTFDKEIARLHGLITAYAWGIAVLTSHIVSDSG